MFVSRSSTSSTTPLPPLPNSLMYVYLELRCPSSVPFEENILGIRFPLSDACEGNKSQCNAITAVLYLVINTILDGWRFTNMHCNLQQNHPSH